MTVVVVGNKACVVALMSCSAFIVWPVADVDMVYAVLGHWVWLM